MMGAALSGNIGPTYVFNIFDFEFFNIVAKHRRVTV